jgi:hypothetical protein
MIVNYIPEKQRDKGFRFEHVNSEMPRKLSIVETGGIDSIQPSFFQLHLLS